MCCALHIAPKWQQSFIIVLPTLVPLLLPPKPKAIATTNLPASLDN
jgi:hypothetical protein